MMTCKNCTTSFSGKFCNNCGEKVVETKDFTIAHILGEAIGAVTNFDSKLFQTLQLLFFYPGKLSTLYVSGIRVPYMKPFQLFLIANVIFFLFLSDVDVFRTPAKWFFVETTEGIGVIEYVKHLETTRALSRAEIATLYDNKSENLAKGLIIFLIPFIAIIGLMLNWRKEWAFGKHVIFAIHFFTFVLLMCVLSSELMYLLSDTLNKWFFIIPITTFMTLYYVIGMRQFYQNNWLQAVAKGFAGTMLINVIIQFYRMGINFLALNSI